MGSNKQAKRSSGDKTMMMYCPQCGAGLGGKPEDFIQERRCPACDVSNIFVRRSKSESPAEKSTPEASSTPAAPSRAFHYKIALVGAGLLFLGVAGYAVISHGQLRGQVRQLQAQARQREQARREEEAYRTKLQADYSRRLVEVLKLNEPRARHEAVAAILATMQGAGHDVPIRTDVYEALLETRAALQDRQFETKAAALVREEKARMSVQSQALEVRIRSLEDKARRLENEADALRSRLRRKEEYAQALTERMQLREGEAEAVLAKAEETREKAEKLRQQALRRETRMQEREARLWRLEQEIEERKEEARRMTREAAQLLMGNRDALVEQPTARPRAGVHSSSYSVIYKDVHPYRYYSHRYGFGSSASPFLIHDPDTGRPLYYYAPGLGLPAGHPAVTLRPGQSVTLPPGHPQVTTYPGAYPPGYHPGGSGLYFSFSID